MRIAREVVATTNAQSIVELLSLAAPDTRGTEEIILQAPAGNSSNINFGTKAAQPGYIIPGGSASLEVGSLRNVYVKGDGSDTVIILVLR